jgi:hypothetical protein
VSFILEFLLPAPSLHYLAASLPGNIPAYFQGTAGCFEFRAL